MIITSPKAKTYESREWPVCSGTRNQARLSDEMCLFRINEGWKECKKCLRAKELKEIKKEGDR